MAISKTVLDGYFGDVHRTSQRHEARQTRTYIGDWLSRRTETSSSSASGHSSFYLEPDLGARATVEITAHMAAENKPPYSHPVDSPASISPDEDVGSSYGGA